MTNENIVGTELKEVSDIMVQNGKICVLYDLSTYTVLKWGDQEFVNNEFTRFKEAYVSAGYPDVADDLGILTFEYGFDLETLGKIVGSAGYLESYILNSISYNLH